MKVTSAHKAKLGLFVVVAVAVGFVLITTFATLSPFDHRKHYYLRVPDASGLDVGTPVRVRGVKVGTIESIQIAPDDPQQVELTLDLDRRVLVDRDALAFLELAGVTGRKEVNIHTGPASAEPLPSGSYLERGETMFDKLPSEAEQLIAQAGKLLESTNMLVQTMQSAVDQVDPTQLDAVLASTEQLMRQLAATSKQLDALVRETREPLRQTVETANATMEQMNKLANATDKVVANLDGAITDLRRVVGNNDADVRATMKNLRGATRDLKELSRELRRKPRLLLFGEAREDRELP